MSKIVVLNGIKKEEYQQNETTMKQAIISISDCYEKTNFFYNDNEGIIDSLYLHFDNVESGEQSMTEYDAMHVAKFVEDNKTKVDVFAVHCEHGCSRVSGVAAAILKYLTGDDSEILKSSKYAPNYYCYNKTLTAFENLKHLKRFQSNHVRQLFIIKAYDVILEAFQTARCKPYDLNEMYYKEFINHSVIFFLENNNKEKADQIKQLGEGMKGWHHSKYQASLSIGVAANELYRIMETCSKEDIPYYKNACIYIGLLYADAFCNIGGFSSAKKIIKTAYKLAKENEGNNHTGYSSVSCFMKHETERIEEFITI